MKKLLLLPIVFITVLGQAQFTAIPDANFEQELINLGYDTGVPNGVVPTANISSVSTLDVSFMNITDLTGIEDFTALAFLEVHFNQLTSLDVTQNSALAALYCQNNQLTTLDVTQNPLLGTLSCGNNLLTNINTTQNPALYTMQCSGNQIPSLDLTQNLSLLWLWTFGNPLTTLDVTQNLLLQGITCNDNQLTSLDLSQNPAMTWLICDGNQISLLDLSLQTALVQLECHDNNMLCLNVKNGNNANVTIFEADINPNLACIEVDNVAYSNANWTIIDAASSFSTTCTGPCVVGVDELVSLSLELYPNPTTENITIALEEASTGSLRVLNSLGQIVLEDTFEAVKELDINLGEPIGIYFLQLEVDGQVIVKKIMKE